MSIQRWHPVTDYNTAWAEPDPEGKWVTYDDHLAALAALKAEYSDGASTTAIGAMVAGLDHAPVRKGQAMMNEQHDPFCPKNTERWTPCQCSFITLVREDERNRKPSKQMGIADGHLKGETC